MKRWMLVLFLLLVPFTMAPRTSLTPVEPLHFEINHPRKTPRAGGAAPFVITTINVSDTHWDGVWVGLVTNLAMEERAGEVELVSAPQACEDAGRGVASLVCDLGPMAPGEKRSVTVVVRPLNAGDLTLDVTGATELNAEKISTEGGSVRVTVEPRQGKSKV